MPVRAVSITINYTAWNTSTNSGATGDVANHTLKLIKDGTAASPTNSASEVDATNCPGSYKLVLTSAEMTADTVRLAGKSSTANVVIIPSDIITEHGVLPTVQQGNTGALPTGDAAGKVLLQATQPGVTIPTVTTLTNAPGDSAGVGTLLTRLPSTITLTGGAVTVGTNNDKSGYTVSGTVNANAVQWGGAALPTSFTASNFVAAPTAAANATAAAAAILANPSYLLQTDSAGKVGVNNLPVEFLTSAEQTQLTTAVNDLVSILSTEDSATQVTAVQTGINNLLTRLPAALSFDTHGNVNASVASWNGTAIATAVPNTANLDATITSRMATFTYTAPANPTDYAKSNVTPTWYAAPDNADVTTALADLVTLLGRTDPATALATLQTAATAIKAKTDQLTFTGGQVNANASVTAITPVFEADAPISPTFSGGS